MYCVCCACFCLYVLLLLLLVVWDVDGYKWCSHVRYTWFQQFSFVIHVVSAVLYCETHFWWEWCQSGVLIWCSQGVHEVTGVFISTRCSLQHLCSFQHGYYIVFISTRSFISDLTGYIHTYIQTDIQTDGQLKKGKTPLHWGRKKKDPPPLRVES